MPAEAPLPLTEEATKSITGVRSDAADTGAEAMPPKQRTYLCQEELTPVEKASLREESTQFIQTLLK